jgi:hypothetical protein
MSAVHGEVFLITERRRVKAADVDPGDLLALVAEPNWYGGDWHDTYRLSDTMQIPVKVLTAKLRRLKRRGIVDGCPCGCRGDWHLTCPEP